MPQHNITFTKASLVYKDSITHWLQEPHVKEFWDNSQEHRDDIVIFMRGRNEPSPYWNGIFDYWIGLSDNIPYCLVMTSEIISTQTDLPEIWKEHLPKSGKTFSIDFMIGNTKFLNKGLASPTLEAFTQFIQNAIDPSINTFVIDPAESNPKARHVYEKAGFQTRAAFFRDFQGKKEVKHFLMVKQLLKVEQVSNKTQDEMVAFLKHHENYTLFLLGNFEAHGFKMTEAPNSGNFKLIRQSGKIICVFCLCKRGTLLVQSEVQEAVFNLILDSCSEEPIILDGVVGEWNFCAKFWEFLKNAQVIKKETFTSKEVLYALDLSEIYVANENRARLLTAEDYSSWRQLNSAYIQEQQLPSELSDEQVRQDFFWKTRQKIVWGLFSDGKLTSIAELNSKALDLGQVGGVYTSSNYRNQGLAKALMRQVILDSKNIHKIRKLIIFTDEKNVSARRVYESFGVKPIGKFALLFSK